jgi:hypothetical protein
MHLNCAKATMINESYERLLSRCCLGMLVPTACRSQFTTVV